MLGEVVYPYEYMDDWENIKWMMANYDWWMNVCMNDECMIDEWGMYEWWRIYQLLEICVLRY